MSETAPGNLLEVRELTRVFRRSGFFHPQPPLVAVDRVSLAIPISPATTLAIAGESGSGKSTLAAMLLGFLPPTSGDIYFGGTRVGDLSGSAMAGFRREIQAIFQNPFDVFNPFYTVDRVFKVAIRKFGLASSREEARRLTAEALEVVRLRPDQILGKRPHQLSGGQLQRIMIARALLLRPKLIVADEPASMIDASLRAIILDVMASLKNEFGISQIYITHDLSSALQVSDGIMILYRGAVVESGDAQAVIGAPRHPYTQLLIASIPQPDPQAKWEGKLAPFVVDDTEGNAATGCRFYGRCPHRMEVCRTVSPELRAVGPAQQAACHLYPVGIEAAAGGKTTAATQLT